MGQLNHNSAYVYSVDGYTVWERLRVIRNFLKDRKKALALARISLSQLEHKISEEFDAFEREKLKLEIPDLEENTLHCENEVVFLTNAEAELSAKAEETRIEGKTDFEMYEINHFKEHEVRLTHKAKAEILSMNALKPETILELVRCPKAMVDLEASGLLQNVNVFTTVFSDKMLCP